MRKTLWALLGALLAPIAAITMLALPATAQSPANDWRAYRYPELGMTLEFANRPLRKEQPIATEGGGVAAVVLYDKQSVRVFFASVSDISATPGIASRDANTVEQEILTGGAQGRTVTSPATAIRRTAGSGWEASSNDATTAVRMRVFVANGRAYTVMVITTALDQPQLLTDASATRFLDSLILYPPQTAK